MLRSEQRAIQEARYDEAASHYANGGASEERTFFGFCSEFPLGVSSQTFGCSP